ncbi:MAG: hypothetical protein IKG22_02400 [Atopobiaceae bacterium]|nr:hypothetical protein [Atopobiaceae bacterium]
MLRCGAGKATIDLEGVLPHDGFAGVHDELGMRALVFEDETGRRYCLLSVEETSLRDDASLRAAASQTVGCAKDAVWISVTHTFSAPHVRTPGHLSDDAARERNELFARRLVEAAQNACEQAVCSRSTARFAIATGSCSVNANRDVETPEGWWLGINQDGFSDRTVRVLSIRSATDPERVIATVFTADVQSSVVQGLCGANGELLVSGDLAGEAMRRLEGELGGTAIFLTGAAGDQAPRVVGTGALPELANKLAAEVVSALGHAEELQAETLRLSSATVSLPGQRRADFATLSPRLSYAFEQADPELTTVYLARLGSLVVAGIQPEVESRFGARLRDTAPCPFELVTLVNGAQKYLPGVDAYDRITYEAMNSGFARGAEELLEETILDLVKKS